MRAIKGWNGYLRDTFRWNTADRVLRYELPRSCSAQSDVGGRENDSRDEPAKPDI
jgi:hypothetical protein